MADAARYSGTDSLGCTASVFLPMNPIVFRQVGPTWKALAYRCRQGKQPDEEHGCHAGGLSSGSATAVRIDGRCWPASIRVTIAVLIPAARATSAYAVQLAQQPTQSDDLAK